MTLDLAEKWRATFMENWPDDLWDLALPPVEIALSEADRLKIGSATPLFAKAYDLPGRDPAPLACEDELAATLDEMSETGAFLRMGSASFKRPGTLSLPIGSLMQALDTIRAPNERVATFLADSIEHQYPLSLFVFPWQHIPEWAEFRLFIRDGALVGVSQYHLSKRYDELVARLPDIQTRLGDFWSKLAPLLPLSDVIADVFLETQGDQLQAARLIELNPFIRRTDTCLFSWAPGDFDGTFRYVS